MKCDHATVKLDSPSSYGDEKNELNDILEKSTGYHLKLWAVQITIQLILINMKQTWWSSLVVASTRL